MNVKLSIKLSGNGTSKTFTVGYVNGNATDAVLREFADKLAELSNLSTVDTVNKVTTTDITNAN